MSDGQPLPLSFKIIAVVMAVLLTTALFGAIALFTQDREDELVLTFKADDGTHLDFSMSRSDHTTTTPLSMGLDVIRSVSEEALAAEVWPPPDTTGGAGVYTGKWRASIAVQQNHPALAPGQHVLHVCIEEDGVAEYYAMPFRGSLGGTAWDALAGGSGSGGRSTLTRHTHSQLVLFSKP